MKNSLILSGLTLFLPPKGWINPYKIDHIWDLKNCKIFASISLSSSWSSGYDIGNWIWVPKFESWVYRKTFFVFTFEKFLTFKLYVYNTYKVKKKLIKTWIHIYTGLKKKVNLNNIEKCDIWKKKVIMTQMSLKLAIYGLQVRRANHYYTTRNYHSKIKIN